MIKKQDLERAIAEVETVQGHYSLFVQSTQEDGAKQMYEAMAADVTGHLHRLHEQLDQMKYSAWVTRLEPKPPRLRNALYAFGTGGLVCVLGQGFTDMWEAVMGISHTKAGDPTVATMIFLGSLLTGLGWFDKLARTAGAGLAVPVTGFANAMTSAALEYKREGLVYGIGSRMFQLAGAVIVFGVMTAFVVGIFASLYHMVR